MVRAGRVISSVAFCVTVACTGNGNGDSGGDNSFGERSSSSDRVMTDCGVVEEGELQNPVALRNATAVKILRIIGTNLIEVSVETELGIEVRVVKLHGIGPSDQSTAIKNLLRGYVGADAFFVPAGCTAVIRGGSELPVGQIITVNGESISEILVKSGLAGDAQESGSCGGQELALCYAALEESGTGVTEVGDFLWKPESESPYNPGGLSILTNPCNVKVLVDGSELLNYGPSNGRCVTVRAGRSGCDFGENIKVEVIDRLSGMPRTFNGEPHIIIPDGCGRTEFTGTGSVAVLPPPPACVPAIEDFRYVPASPSCDGNIGVELSGTLRGAFSVQLRLPDGSDRLDPACSDFACTPYKVKRYINTEETKTACFGAPGDSPVMSEIIQVSVKMTGDDSTPERYCVEDPSLPIN